MQTVLIQLIRLYRFLLSPWLGQHCRFEPSCSSYALTAIERYGAARGSWLAVKRLTIWQSLNTRRGLTQRRPLVTDLVGD